MKNAVVGLGCVTLIGVMSGCSTTAGFKTDDVYNTSAQITDAQSIEVYSTNRIGKDYQILGQIVASADAGQNAERSVDTLKRQASKLGADAIINLRLAIDAGWWQNAIKATGTAVVFED